MHRLQALTGMPVVCGSRRIGYALRAELDGELRQLDGIWVVSGLRGARYIPAESLELLGRVAVLAEDAGHRGRMSGMRLPMRAVSTDGRRLGAVTGAQIDEVSFAVISLELSTGLWNDLLWGRRRLTRYAVNLDRGEVIVDPDAGIEEELCDEDRNDEGIDHRHADRGLGRHDIRRAELAEGAKLEPEGQADGQLDIGSGGEARQKAVTASGSTRRSIRTHSVGGWRHANTRLPIAQARRRRIRLAGGLIAALAAIIALRHPVLQIGRLVLGASILCFLMAPLARSFEKKLSRSTAALACAVCAIAAVALVILVLLPVLLRELAALSRSLPQTVARAMEWIEGGRFLIQSRFPGLSIPNIDLSRFSDFIGDLANGTFGLASNLAGTIGRASMTAVLAYFLLRDRERALLRLELLLPLSCRETAVRMGNAVCRELRLYLKAQLLIASAVGLLSGTALTLIGLRGALLLGPIIGLLNMIPYFGPFIGGVPAVLIALGDGWKRAGLTVLALAAVQQADSIWLSPRIMGSVTGFSAALVLLGIYAGAQLGGVAGILFALPVMMTVRTLFRVFVQKCENI